MTHIKGSIGCLLAHSKHPINAGWCWGPQQRCYQPESTGSVPRLLEHKQRQGSVRQKDSTRMMGVALALQALQGRTREGEMRAHHEG